MSVDYDFQCEACGHVQEFTLRSPDSPRPRKCPACGKHKLVKLFAKPTIYIHGINTVGQQAEANEKRLGKEQVQKLAEQHKQRYQKNEDGLKEKPFYQQGSKPLDYKKLKDPQKYIEEGRL